MQEPLFYQAAAHAKSELVVLDDDTARHVTQVLRKKEGDKIQLTDGQGTCMHCVLTSVEKKTCTVLVEDVLLFARPATKNTIAISPLKNVSRLEWFLEKATELGIHEIVLLQSERTEKQHVKLPRLQNILVSAMLQSRQYFLPTLITDQSFLSFINTEYSYRYIAHCEDDPNKFPLVNQSQQTPGNRVVLIGPEGDFTHLEIEAATTLGYVPVSLGTTRLRTETAGLVAACYLAGNSFT